MTNAITDALLVTLANVEAYGGETFELDTAVKVLEERLGNTPWGQRRGTATSHRSRSRLAAQGGDPERIAFFENIGEGLGLEEDD